MGYVFGNEFYVDYLFGWVVILWWVFGVGGYMMVQIIDDWDDGQIVVGNCYWVFVIGLSFKYVSCQGWFVIVKW